jgi:hypothetical protein
MIATNARIYRHRPDYAQPLVFVESNTPIRVARLRMVA